jgi:hypothetical protein
MLWPLNGVNGRREAGWLTALKLEEYAPRRSSDSMALQEVLLPYLDAL